MKKTLLSICILGMMTGTAIAQTNVTIYGTVDTGIIKETGSDTRMGNNDDGILGFKGTEYLGNGSRAFFKLERRFNLNDGTRYEGNCALDKLQGNDGAEWQGGAWVGLGNDTYGSISLGRINNIAVDNYYPTDPFTYIGVGMANTSNNIIYSEQLASSIRYDSPDMAGIIISASYTLGKDTHPEGYQHSFGNDGFGLGAKYENNGIRLTANYDRLADSDKSWLWNIGASYSWNGFTVSAGYQGTTVKTAASDALGYGNNTIKQKDWLIGLMYETGPHTFKASYNRGDLESDGRYDGNMNKYSLGYTYALSKRTSLYGMAAYTDNDNESVGSVYNTNHAEIDSVTGIEFGINHRF